MVTVSLPYVTQRGRSFRYRRRPPPELAKAIAKATRARPNFKQWIKTWRPGTSWSQIEREARRLVALHDQVIEAARHGHVEEIAAAVIKERGADWFRDFVDEGREDFGHEPSAQTSHILRALDGGGTLPPEPVPPSKLVERDLDLHMIDKDQRPVKQALKSFVGFHGDLDVMTITRTAVTRWINYQIDKGLAPNTVKRRFTALAAAVSRYWLDNDITRRSPFERHRIEGHELVSFDYRCGSRTEVSDGHANVAFRG